MSLPVAIVCDNERRGRKLMDLLQANGLGAVLYTACDDRVLGQIENNSAAVIVDLDGAVGDEQRVIDVLSTQEKIPVLFNDSTCLDTHAAALERDLGEQIAGKVLSAIELDIERRDAATAAPRRVPPVLHLTDGDTGPADASGGGDDGIAREVWVLAASLGGPDAVKRFISRIPLDVSVSFILVQRITAEYIPLLRDQLRRATSLKVLTARSGHLLRHGQLLVVPADHPMTIDDEGRVRLMPDGAAPDAPPPSIDAVMTAVARRFGRSCGAIVFSGIGNDGVMGAQAIQAHGGTVWAQDAGSCIMSSMPDHVRSACNVDLSDSPEALAGRLVHDLRAREIRAAG